MGHKERTEYAAAAADLRKQLKEAVDQKDYSKVNAITESIKRVENLSRQDYQTECSHTGFDDR